jgi:hypothetical protein
MVIRFVAIAMQNMKPYRALAQERPRHYPVDANLRAVTIAG